MNCDFIIEIPLTSVSAVWSHGDFCLDRSDLGFGLFVLGVIVPIPPHTQNINQHSASLQDENYILSIKH
jgi:hypothetical protein